MQLAKDRKQFIEEVTTESFNNLKHITRGRSLREELEMTVYREKLRIKANPWRVDPKDEKSFWKSVQDRLSDSSALPPEEASYPNTSHDSNHQTLDGQYRYRIHWDREQSPPVNAFWSLTIYDEAGYMIENPINRYRMGSNNDLNWNADGSLELQLQSSAPDTTSANWLPVPKGEFNIVLRMYWPQPDFLENNWQLPIIERLP